MAEILKGNPEEVVTQLTEIIKKKKGYKSALLFENDYTVYSPPLAGGG